MLEELVLEITWIQWFLNKDQNFSGYFGTNWRISKIRHILILNYRMFFFIISYSDRLTTPLSISFPELSQLTAAISANSFQCQI